VCTLQLLAAPQESPQVNEVVDALLTASRALVAVAARSLAGLEGEVTLPQYRALVVLAGHGPQTVGQLADHLDLHPSTTTRLCDRLVAKGLIGREVSLLSRREITISLAGPGRRVVQEVTRRRRREIERIVADVPPRLRRSLVSALRAFSDAAGEIPEQAWSLGWS
jgi:DNA-binding MarR family transcriptional regulator